MLGSRSTRPTVNSPVHRRHTPVCRSGSPHPRPKDEEAGYRLERACRLPQNMFPWGRGPDRQASLPRAVTESPGRQDRAEGFAETAALHTETQCPRRCLGLLLTPSLVETPGVSHNPAPRAEPRGWPKDRRHSERGARANGSQGSLSTVCISMSRWRTL